MRAVGDVLLEPQDLVNRDSLRAAFDPDPAQWPEHQTTRTELLARQPGGLRDHRVDAPALRARLHPGGEVHVVPHHGIVEPRLRTHVADHARPGVETDAGPQMVHAWRPSVALAFPFFLQLHNLALDQLGGHARPEGVVGQLDRRPVHRHHRITDELVEHPALALHDVGAGAEVLVQQFPEFRRRQNLGKRGELLDVAEIGGDLRVVSAQFRIPA